MLSFKFQVYFMVWWLLSSIGSLYINFQYFFVQKIHRSWNVSLSIMPLLAHFGKDKRFLENPSKIISNEGKKNLYFPTWKFFKDFIFPRRLRWQIFFLYWSPWDLWYFLFYYLLPLFIIHGRKSETLNWKFLCEGFSCSWHEFPSPKNRSISKKI